MNSYNNLNINRHHKAFGSVMPGRSFIPPTPYRYGFGGQEKDDEVSGSGNSYTAEFWQYSPRLGRRWNLDPKPTPFISSYSAFANNPNLFTDAQGDTIVISIVSHELNEKGGQTAMVLASNDMVENQINDGYFILVAHGTPGIIQNDIKKDYTYQINNPHELFKLLNDNPAWSEAKKKKQNITLILGSCNAATCPEEYYNTESPIYDKPIAQRLSEVDKDITVVGATGNVQYGKLEDERVGSIGRKGKYGLKGIRSETGNDGGWVTYKGGEKVGAKVVVGDYKSKPPSNSNKPKSSSNSNKPKSSSNSKKTTSKARFD